MPATAIVPRTRGAHATRGANGRDLVQQPEKKCDLRGEVGGVPRRSSPLRATTGHRAGWGHRRARSTTASASAAWIELSRNDYSLKDRADEGAWLCRPAGCPREEDAGRLLVTWRADQSMPAVAARLDPGSVSERGKTTPSPLAVNQGRPKYWNNRADPLDLPIATCSRRPRVLLRTEGTEGNPNEKPLRRGGVSWFGIGADFRPLRPRPCGGCRRTSA